MAIANLIAFTGLVDAGKNIAREYLKTKNFSALSALDLVQSELDPIWSNLGFSDLNTATPEQYDNVRRIVIEYRTTQRFRHAAYLRARSGGLIVNANIMLREEADAFRAIGGKIFEITKSGYAPPSNTLLPNRRYQHDWEVVQIAALRSAGLLETGAIVNPGGLTTNAFHAALDVALGITTAPDFIEVDP
jgi:hypothetical protein